MSKQKGFRLKRMEIYNWGTFNQRVYALNIEGENGLLTGDIGSGKSTVVDAITTLLVPNQKITYNKAAGSLAKERTLYSYVVGEYKNTLEEGMSSSKAVALRDTKHYSVLLATFENSLNNETVSIAQFFWLSQGSRVVNKLFVVAKRALSIEEHFLNFVSIKELKKSLSSMEGVSTPKTFKDYSKTFMRLTKIQSAQALNLFYQTVSMKSVGNLTSFVRSHMLEESGLDSKIDELCSNFDELNQSHDTVLRAKKQMEILSPLIAYASKYRENLKAKKAKEKLRELLSAYFAKEKIVLVTRKLNQLEIEETKIQSKIKEHSHSLEEMQEQHFELKDALQRSGGEKILSISKEIVRKTYQRDSRKKVHNNYHLLSKKLGLASVSSEHTFLTNLAKVEKSLIETEEKKEAFDTEKFLQRSFLDKKNKDLIHLEDELGFLRQRKSNIPMQNAKIRDQIAKDIGIELFFVGELLRITDKGMGGSD
ncbi:MAG: ATP-binding protein [Sulfurovum sp.]|nr:ATP-binding protein [Sulfurovum sp.]